MTKDLELSKVRKAGQIGKQELSKDGFSLENFPHTTVFSSHHRNSAKCRFMDYWPGVKKPHSTNGALPATFSVAQLSIMQKRGKDCSVAKRCVSEQTTTGNGCELDIT